MALPFPLSDLLVILPELVLTELALGILLWATVVKRENERAARLGVARVAGRHGGPHPGGRLLRRVSPALRLRRDVRPRRFRHLLQGADARGGRSHDPLLAPLRRDVPLPGRRVLRAPSLLNGRHALHGVGDAPRLPLHRTRADGSLAVRPGGLLQAGDEVDRGRGEVLRPRSLLVGRPALRPLARLRRDGDARPRRRLGGADGLAPLGPPDGGCRPHGVRDALQDRVGTVPRLGARRVRGGSDAGLGLLRRRPEGRGLRDLRPHLLRRLRPARRRLGAHPGGLGRA